MREAETNRVFAGPARKFNLTWHNPASAKIEIALHARLHQASSATTAPITNFLWKKLQVLPGQTIIESAVLDFPEVKARTRFLIQWTDDTDKILGRSDVLVYPTDLLKQLKALAGEDGPGLFDPANVLKPLLKNLAIQFIDLEDNGIASFTGKLAIIGPFTNRAGEPRDLTHRIKTAAAKGAAIVWLQALLESEKEDQLLPSFYSLPERNGLIIVAQSSLVPSLKDDPQSQLNLLSLCRRALKRELIELQYQPQDRGACYDPPAHGGQFAIAQLSGLHISLSSSQGQGWGEEAILSFCGDRQIGTRPKACLIPAQANGLPYPPVNL